MVMIEGSLIVFGVMISYWIDLGFSFLEPSSIAWRFPIAFQIVLAVFILCFIPGLPESPRWLVLKGRDDEALEVLAALSNLPVSDKKIQAEFLSVNVQGRLPGVLQDEPQSQLSSYSIGLCQSDVPAGKTVQELLRAHILTQL
jgi:MFS family permease